MKVKDFITEALFKLMSKKNYSDISVTEITDKAGVNRVSFYRNFNSKDEIVLKCLEENYNTFKIKYQNENNNENGFYQMLKYFEESKDILRPLYKSHAEYLFLNHILNLWNSNKDDVNVVAYTKSAWAYFMLGWANEWYLRGMNETPEEMLKLIENYQKKN